MIRRVLILAAVACITCGAQTTSDDRVRTVELMCGTVTVDHELFGSKVEPDGVHGAVVRVYARPEGSSCCANLPLVAESTTGFSGSFRFKREKRIPEGNYWLTVELKKTSKGYALPVILARIKGVSGDECERQVFEIMASGEIVYNPTITLD